MPRLMAVSTGVGVAHLRTEYLVSTRYRGYQAPIQHSGSSHPWNRLEPRQAQRRKRVDASEARHSTLFLQGCRFAVTHGETGERA